MRERLRPAPPPWEVDMVVISRAGLLIWSLGLLVTGGLALFGKIGIHAPATCAAGVVIGGLLLNWAYRHRRRMAPATDESISGPS